MRAPEATTNMLSDPADALQRIEEVLRLSRSAIWEVDRQGVYTFASASHEELIGYRPEELVGIRNIRDFYPPDPPADLRAQLEEDWIGAGVEYTQLEMPLVSRSGEIVWVTSHGKPIFDSVGNVVGFRGADIDITARKRDQQLLWQQVHEAPAPMAWTTLSGTPGDLHVNRAFVATFGYEPAEIPTSEAWFAKAYPDEEYRARVLSDTAAVLAQSASGARAPAPREYRITCKDGRVLDVEIAASSIAGRFVGTFVDVTARRRQLEEQRAREEELQRVLDHLPFPVATSVAGPDIVWGDPRAKVTYLNRSFTAVFGYMPEDMPTISDCARLFYPDDKYRASVFAELDRQVQAALAEGTEVGPFESRVMTKNREERDVVIKAIAVGGRLVISLEDVTERKRALRELEESGQRLRDVIENTPVPVSYTRDGARTLSFNKTFTDTYGWREEDVPTYEEWFRKIYPDPDYRREVLAVWDADVQRARESDGKIAPRLYRLTAKDGSVREVEISAAILEGEMFGTFLDLTERNRAEALLRERQEQLTRVGRVSTLGQLAASLAHELEQPLAAILRNAETADLLLQGGQRIDRAELGAIVTDILSDDRRAGAVLDRIRAMVRQQKFEPHAVPVWGLLQESASLARTAVSTRGIDLQISCEPGVPEIVGDTVLLQQALLNLIINSSEAIGARAGGRIDLRACMSEPDVVEIAVADNGGGAPVEHVGKLFEPFHTTKADGLGMGLPLVKSIIEQHGGKVRVSNQAGQGMTVHLQLPVHLAGGKP